ncbi:MAG: hypothetical protein HY298_06780 [Verrucomicrobia bacterium]|nr:hypothetical protein [Verrucomicrobiota bacterium]
MAKLLTSQKAAPRLLWANPWHRTRSAAVSKTSRSRFAISGRSYEPNASGHFDVLRLVEDDTDALRFSFGGSIEMRTCAFQKFQFNIAKSLRKNIAPLRQPY